jgi:hypothetical protein
MRFGLLEFNLAMLIANFIFLAVSVARSKASKLAQARASAITSTRPIAYPLACEVVCHGDYTS